MPASPTPRWKARLADLGGIALTGSPSDFGKLIVEETEKWGQGGEVCDLPRAWQSAIP
jgi:hypothetical protein